MHPNEKINQLKIDIPLAESNKSVIFTAQIAEPSKIFKFATKKRQKIMAFSHLSIFKTMKVIAMAVSEV